MFGNGPQPYGGQQPYGQPYPGTGQPGPPGYYPPPGFPPQGFPPPKRSNTGLIIGVGIGLIAVVAGVAVLLLTRGPGSTPQAQDSSATTSTHNSGRQSDPGKPIERTKLAQTVKTQLDAKTGEQSASVMCMGDLAAAVGSTQRCVLIRTDGMVVGLTVSVVGNDADSGKLQLHIEADPKPLLAPPTFPSAPGTP